MKNNTKKDSFKCIYTHFYVDYYNQYHGTFRIRLFLDQYKDIT